MNVDDFADNISATLYEAAEKVLGRQRKIHKPWISNEILDLCDTRRQLKKHKFVDQVGATNYREANNQVRSKLRKAKQQWIEDQCDRIDEEMKRGNSKQAYNTLKK